MDGNLPTTSRFRRAGSVGFLGVQGAGTFLPNIQRCQFNMSPAIEHALWCSVLSGPSALYLEDSVMFSSEFLRRAVSTRVDRLDHTYTYT